MRCEESDRDKNYSAIRIWLMFRCRGQEARQGNYKGYGERRGVVYGKGRGGLVAELPEEHSIPKAECVICARIAHPTPSHPSAGSRVRCRWVACKGAGSRVRCTGYAAKVQVGGLLHTEAEEGGIVGRRELKADLAVDHG